MDEKEEVLEENLSEKEAKGAKKGDKEGIIDTTPIENNALFWQYFQMGEERSLAKLSKITKVPLWKLKKISTQENWAQKIQEQEKLLEDAVNFEKNANLIAMSQYAVYATCMSIVNNPKASASDKLKAIEKLNELGKRASELRQNKKIVIHLENEEKIKEALRSVGIPVD